MDYSTKPIIVQINGKVIGSLNVKADKYDAVQDLNGKKVKMVVVQDKLINIVVR